jgi:hypothetical protein
MAMMLGLKFNEGTFSPSITVPLNVDAGDVHIHKHT